MSKAAAKIAKKFLITGRAQGVGFRFFADRWASQLGICGYVKNLWDGNVEVAREEDDQCRGVSAPHLAGPKQEETGD